MAEKSSHKVRETVSITLGTLSADDVVGQNGLTMLQGGFITTTDIAWVISGLTAGEGEGLFLGIADQQLSDAEIEESLEANGPTFSKQEPQAPRADRRVRTLGLIGPQALNLTPTNTVFAGFMAKAETRLAFSEDGASWKWFVQSLAVGTTTGASVSIQASHNVRWSRA